jgi:ribosomal protein L33
MASRNKKLQSDPVEKMKYNRFMRKHTLHKEIKS